MREILIDLVRCHCCLLMRAVLYFDHYSPPFHRIPHTPILHTPITPITHVHTPTPRIMVHTQKITDLSMSPDGLVLASSSEDGHLKFWQIDWDNKSHKCLHDYVPHNGHPVTRLIFCDDHMNHDSSYVCVGNYSTLWGCGWD